jgi:SnoaL-like domain
MNACCVCRLGMPASEGVVLTVLTYLKNGKIDDAIARFAEEFRFKDHGMGVELNDRERLREFFLKTWKFYLDSFWQTDTIFACSNHLITKWTLHASWTEASYGEFPRSDRISLHGASIVRTGSGKIIDWSNYDDGLTSRRTGLASYITESVDSVVRAFHP